MAEAARGAGLEGDEQFSFRNVSFEMSLDIQAVMSNRQVNMNREFR